MNVTASDGKTTVKLDPIPATYALKHVDHLFMSICQLLSRAFLKITDEDDRKTAMDYLLRWQALPGVCSATQNSETYELAKFLKIAHKPINHISTAHEEAPENENNAEKRKREKRNRKNEMLRGISKQYANPDIVKRPQSMIDQLNYIAIWCTENGQWSLQDIKEVKPYIAQLALSVWPAVVEAVKQNHADLVVNRLPGDLLNLFQQLRDRGKAAIVSDPLVSAVLALEKMNPMDYNGFPRFLSSLKQFAATVTKEEADLNRQLQDKNSANAIASWVLIMVKLKPHPQQSNQAMLQLKQNDYSIEATVEALGYIYATWNLFDLKKAPKATPEANHGDAATPDNKKENAKRASAACFQHNALSAGCTMKRCTNKHAPAAKACPSCAAAGCPRLSRSHDGASHEAFYKFANRRIHDTKTKWKQGIEPEVEKLLAKAAGKTTDPKPAEEEQAEGHNAGATGDAQPQDFNSFSMDAYVHMAMGGMDPYYEDGSDSSDYGGDGIQPSINLAYLNPPSLTNGVRFGEASHPGPAMPM